MHREELALDQVRLCRLAKTDRNIRLAHAQVELVVVEDEAQFHLRVEIYELVQPLGEPGRAQAHRRGDAQGARRLFPAVCQPGLDRLQLHEHFARGAVQHLALFGEQQAARVAVEERHLEIMLQRADLAAHRGLAHVERVARVGEAAGLCGGVKDAQFVPVQRHV